MLTDVVHELRGGGSGSVSPRVLLWTVSQELWHSTAPLHWLFEQ